MHTLANRIALGIALFTLLVIGVLVVKGRSARVERERPAATAADLTIKQVRLHEVSGKVHWSLEADQAAVYRDEGRTTLKNVRLHIQEPGRAWTVTGEEGDLHERERDVELRRHVVLVSDDGLRLETSVLRWHGKDQRLWTDAPFTLVRANTTVRGQALDVLTRDEIAVARGPVRATFGGEAHR